MNALTIIWTALAIVGLTVCLINLADAWADNATLQDDTRDGLADLQAAGNVIAIDNVGREVLCSVALLACLVIGVLVLMTPPAPPAAPPVQQARSMLSLVFSVCLIVVEVCLVLVSILGRVRRINVRRMLDMTIKARAEARDRARQADIASSAAANVTDSQGIRAAVDEAAAEAPPAVPSPENP